MLKKDDEIKNYVLEKYLGEGAFGEVWLAKKQIELSDEGISVALKFLKYKPSRQETEASFINKVKREVATWVRASGHKNIVAVQDGFQFQDDTFVIVSDFAEGGDLGNWLLQNNGKSPDLAKTVEIIGGILDGLQHLHSQTPEKIIHRDLKPDNILFKNDVPCIADFGVSKMSNTMTNSIAKGTRTGTPLYISPESLQNKPASRSVDIWSMGVMLYEMLSGKFPFPLNGDNIYALMMDIVQNSPQPLPSDIPVEFQKVVAKALEKDVAKRFQSAEMMKTALKDALQVWEKPKIRQVTIDDEAFQRLERQRLEAEAKEAERRQQQMPQPKPNAFKNSIGMEFVKIPAGTFMMGSPESESDRNYNETQHQVTISKDFYLGKYQVTQAQWKAVMESNPSKFKGDSLPIEQVSWDDAQAFIKALNAKNDGYIYRLPSEAEWEYAARGGKEGDVFGIGDGKNLSSNEANFDGNYPYGNAAKGKYLEKTAPVGSYQPNKFGLYDMHGNVWEWCSDWYGEYPSGSVTDPTGASSGSNRVIRGGSWYGYGRIIRSAFRNNYSASDRSGNLGFRLVRVS